ncbi:Smr/MutS family protein [Octadecabacter sp. 1_MG-2023]|uniref:Smr/MutS family protein n=1 Tax=unclassified Octadecabacter TaxID=196158 RepID=UPI001C08CF42|nr:MULTISPECIES: Smr/MutS family protein [unclassified Octadecabacter]MBU2992322.1 Smr/MutS family protein [Octadecabacter sp. B2R22]MDO6734921.1 Smr/MutS family protein [Octadecabacter sp. 1_MG-2023]
MKKPRNVSAEERALWETVAKRTEALQKPASKLVRAAPTKPMTEISNRAPRPIPAFKVGQSVDHKGDHDLLPSLGQQLRSDPVQMDNKAYGRMKRGKLKPDARIDLHGMTMAQAHPALTGFVLRSASAGHRLVLVITGKGKHRDDGGPIPTKFGVLRHQVPQWLKMAPLAGLVMQVSESHIRHGGQGAYYVYLRRSR